MHKLDPFAPQQCYIASALADVDVATAALTAATEILAALSESLQPTIQGQRDPCQTSNPSGSSSDNPPSQP